ncbi:MAG: PTS fructose transporter subunit IIA [Pseudomonadota bacterium]
MIGLLIVAHGTLGESLVECATYVLGSRPAKLLALDVRDCSNTDEILAVAKAQLAELDSGDGVLVMADIYGATPCNMLCSLIQPGRVELVAGVNLPMLLKVLNYRHESLPALVTRALKGGGEGIFHVTHCHA